MGGEVRDGRGIHREACDGRKWYFSRTDILLEIIPTTEREGVLLFGF